MSAAEPLESRWSTIRDRTEIADVGFFLLRVTALAGNFGWLLITELSAERARTFHWIILYFIAYNLVLYLLLISIAPARKRILYAVSLVFDLSYVSLLVAESGGFDSSFFIGYYLLSALHAFYYGLPCALYAAGACAAAYGLATFYGVRPDGVDFALRASFLFLIALPIGFLSGRMRSDQRKIESLNRELLSSIDEWRSLQDKLIRAEKFSALGRLTSDVAHEIRNPLTVVGGFARRLERRSAEGTGEKKYARIIVSEVERLERILKDTLNFSQEAKNHFVHANIGDILLDAGEAFADRCREKGVTLVLEPAAVLPSCIADRDRVRQAVYNLVANAIDAMPSGGKLTLRTRAGQDNGVNYVAMDVIDTGVGIPEEKVDRIFEPFFSTKEIGHGTGLGLSICRKIMEENKGAVRVTSLPGEGSTFSLVLPYLSPEDPFRTQCWEFVRCGVESAEEAWRKCPAYPNYGRICWSIAGSFADDKARCVHSEKVGDCTKCEFYDRLRVRQDL
ncbi:MAG: sensor histidine kinase [Deltaproteobacteria bacterium]|nr:sensor histidine kinase [Deltaproteobacteria bacterium]